MKRYKIIYRAGYENKWYVWQSLFQPFVELAHSLLDILILPTPYRSEILDWYLGVVITAQMKKRIKNRKK